MNPNQEASISNKKDNYLSLNVANQDNTPLLSNRGHSSLPKDRSQQQLRKLRCFNRCRFSVKTFTFWISILDIVLFLITNHFITKDDEELKDCVMYKFGGKYTPAILTYHHIHRLILPIFLHYDVEHIFGNLLSQLMWGFRLEEAIGTRRMIFMYLISGIGGNFMSAVLNVKDVDAGASSAIHGIIGFALPYVVVSAKDSQNDILDHIFTLVTFYSTFKSFFSNEAKIDHDMHRGGFIVGLLIAGLFIRGSSTMGFDRKNKIAIGSLILLVLYFGILSMALLLMSDYHEIAAARVAACAKLLSW